MSLTQHLKNCKSCAADAMPGRDVCFNCDIQLVPLKNAGMDPERHRASDRSMAQRYPKYYKAIPTGVKELDVYAVCQMFPVEDATGCINHARKKLLLPGVRTGGKAMRKEIQEAIDTLNRWLQLNPETPLDTVAPPLAHVPV